MAEEKLLIGYYRLSMEDDTDVESNSITNQRLLVKDYISTVPELKQMEFQEFYDDGYSGASMKRPAIQEVIRLIQADKVGCIVVKDFSRFSRDYIELGTYLEQIFPFMGIRFISISDRYDSLDFIGKASDIEVQFKGLIADFYVKDQSAKVKSAVATKRGKGQYACGNAPYGYRLNPKDKNELLIVEEEAEVIRRVFQLTIERYTKIQISKLFNEEGIPTPLVSMKKRQKDKRKELTIGLVWTSDMIRKILDNKSYMGCMVYGKTKILEPGTGHEIKVPRDEWKVYENHHVPIVSKEIFEQAQSLRPRDNKRSTYNWTNSLLMGYVKCGHCKHRLTSSKEWNGHTHYSCKYSKFEENKGCYSGRLDNKVLEQFVLKEMKQHLQQQLDQARMDKQMRKQHMQQKKAYEKESEECKKAIENLKEQRSKNYEKYHEGSMSREQFMDVKEQSELERERLLVRIQELKVLIDSEEEVLLKKNIPAEQMMEYLGYEKLTREMAEQNLEVIYVYDDGRIEIQWKEL